MCSQDSDTVQQEEFDTRGTDVHTRSPINNTSAAGMGGRVHSTPLRVGQSAFEPGITEDEVLESLEEEEQSKDDSIISMELEQGDLAIWGAGFETNDEQLDLTATGLLGPDNGPDSASESDEADSGESTFSESDRDLVAPGVGNGSSFPSGAGVHDEISFRAGPAHLQVHPDWELE